MRKVFITTLVLTSLLFSGCGARKDAASDINKTAQNSPAPAVNTQTVSKLPKVDKPIFTRDTYPKVDGSTATIPFSEALAANVLGLSNEEAQKFVKHNKTHNAYVNLINGRADIIFVTEPSSDELKLAQDAKIELEVIPVVKEGFVFLVNTKNPINSLSSKQIQEIYQGKFTNWKEIGGEDKEIRAYQRNQNSGSQTLMEQRVMNGLKMAEPPKSYIISEMEGLIESISSYDNSDKAIGYSVFYYAKTMYNKDNIKLLAVDGVAPNNENISSNKYPFSSAYYAVIKKSTPSDASSRKLLNWILSEDGQKLADKAGYVPVQMR